MCRSGYRLGGLDARKPVPAGRPRSPILRWRRRRPIIRSSSCHRDGGRRTHKGIDLAAPAGTPVYATGAGTVILASEGSNGGYGNVIKIRHDDGTVTVYAHLKTGTQRVSHGQRVEAGAYIAGINNTGIRS